ncbi:MAG: hypothetical protein IJD67_01740 [Clostridia bacterium]|nr:hypothetical protein [Clostridia bacterium]
MKNFYYDDGTKLNEYLARANELKKSILNSPNTEFDIKGTKYYISTDGNDANDGKSESAPIATLERLEALELMPGDAVYFRRGDTWRGLVTLKEGITYTAYGEGEKPRIFGSLNGVGKEKWSKTDKENVWVYSELIPADRDIGNICINEGKCWGIKVSRNGINRAPDSKVVFNGIEKFYSGGHDFFGYQDLKNNLEFFHDWRDQKLYFYCTYGNPGEYFYHMEIARKRHVMSGCGNNVTIDNIAVMHAGSHGIAGFAGKLINFTVQNCYLAWIGGSIQFETENHVIVRLGNAIEKYGSTGCDGYYIRNCYSYQIYDCAYTVQYQGDADTRDDCIFKNVEYLNNVAEKCNTGLEIWQRNTKPENNKRFVIENMHLHDNYTLYAGYGWGNQRPNKDGNFFYGETAFNTTEYINCSVERHYGLLSCCYALLVRNIAPDKYNFHDNVYFMEKGKRIGGVCENPGDGTGAVWQPDFNEESIAEFTRRGGEPGTEWYILDKQNIDGYGLE